MKVNRDFIKWMCGYADDFDLINDGDEMFEELNLYYQGFSIDALSGDIKSHWMYEHILTRAIEGVNRAQEKFSIQSSSHNKTNRISVYNTITGKVEMAECFGGDIDQAKEAALQWVKENS